MKRFVFYLIINALFAAVILAQVERTYEVCGNPQLQCKTSFKFQTNDFPFKVTGELEWFGTYKSKEFYAVILQSRKAVPDPDGLAGAKQCSGHFTESERRKAQSLFPNNKVFASQFGCDHFQIEYTNVKTDYNFLAVYAGETQKEADELLEKVKASGKFVGANVRKMQVVLCNGCH